MSKRRRRTITIGVTNTCTIHWGMLQKSLLDAHLFKQYYSSVYRNRDDSTRQRRRALAAKAGLAVMKSLSCASRKS